MRKPHNGLLTLQALTAAYPMGELPQPEKPVKCKSKAERPLEKDVQRKILSLLKRHPKVAWAERMNTGSFKIGANAVDKGRYLKFGFVGCSDIFGQLKTGQFLAVEVKRKGGKLSEPQKAFLETVNKNGGIGILAYSVDDVLTRLGDL